jgi:hypothetical protein
MPRRRRRCSGGTWRGCWGYEGLVGTRRTLAQEERRLCDKPPVSSLNSSCRPSRSSPCSSDALPPYVSTACHSGRAGRERRGGSQPPTVEQLRDAMVSSSSSSLTLSRGVRTPDLSARPGASLGRNRTRWQAGRRHADQPLLCGRCLDEPVVQPDPLSLWALLLGAATRRGRLG